MAGLLMVAPACVAATASQEPAGPDRVERPLWYPIVEEMLGAPGTAKGIRTSNYRVFGLNHERLAELLAKAPIEQPGYGHKGGAQIPLPMPDGPPMSFYFEEAVIAGPGLKLQCPQVRTYRARLTETAGFGQFEWSPSGFKAVVSGVAIRPYSHKDTRYYVVYYERDHAFVREGDTQPPPTSKSAESNAPTVPSATTDAEAIEEITLQRGCFHCENQYKLSFRGDGTATLMRTGVLSGGVNTHTCVGRVPREALAELSAFMHKEGFFKLNDNYLELPDGGVVTSAVLDGRRKVVANSSSNPPPSLKAIEKAIDALGERISWGQERP